MNTIIKTDQGISVSAQLVFANVGELLAQGNVFLKQHQTKIFIINCESMQRIDSAGIAALLEWQKQCVDSEIKCRFVGLSEQAQSLIQAYRLGALIAT